MPDILIWTYAGLVGAAIGSFLNVCINRWPEGESVIRPRSRCPSCEAAIAWYDNIPIASYALLRGRCRSCRAPISAQYPLIELATALIWVAAAVRFGLDLEALRSAIFLTLLLGIAMTDAKAMVIPDQFSLGGALVGLVLAAVPGGFPFVDALIGSIAGYALLMLVMWGGEKLFRKPALGLGDVHMMAMVGAFVGLGGALLTVLLGSVLGLVIGVPILWWRGRSSVLGAYLPLGTFLAMGAAVAHGWGDILINAYLDLILGPR
jgi:leader peptidase (prepilin peptidase) / N-methyltransferase